MTDTKEPTWVDDHAAHIRETVDEMKRSRAMFEDPALHERIRQHLELWKKAQGGDHGR
jgi:hypothetical protein